MPDKLTRTHYRDPTQPGEPPRTLMVRDEEALVDFEQHTRPLLRAHVSTLLITGVADGFEVRAEAGAPDLRVLAGVGVTPRGDHVVLSPAGQAKLEQPRTLVAVGEAGAVVPTAGLDGPFVLTVTFDETFDRPLWQASDKKIFQRDHTPWLRLQPADGFTAGADQIELARVIVGAGKVGALEPGNRRASAGALPLQRVTGTADGGQLAVRAEPAGELSADPDGTLRLNARLLRLPALANLGEVTLTANAGPSPTLSVTAALDARNELTLSGRHAVAGGADGVLRLDPAGHFPGGVHAGTVVRAGSVTAEGLTVRGAAGFGTGAPLAKLHAVATGGFGPEDADGRPTRTDLAILARSTTDSAPAFGLLNRTGRAAFAIAVDGDDDDPSSRGTTVLWECASGDWHGVLGLGEQLVRVGHHGRSDLDVSGSLLIGGNLAARASDGTLQLNPAGQFGNGVRTPNALGAGSLSARDSVRIGAAIRPDAAAALVIDDASANNTWNTAAFRKKSLGDNWSHIHWGPTGDWYIRSASGSGKVVLQDSGGSVELVGGGGQVFIGGNVTGPFLKLHDDLWFSDPQNGTIHVRSGNNATWGQLVGIFTQASSAASKQDIERLDEDALAGLHEDALRTPVARFGYRGARDPQRRRLGVILEDCPTYLGDGIGINPVEYAAMLHAAIKVLSGRLDRLAARLENSCPRS